MNAVLPLVEARRAKAGEVFRARGVPHRRVEAWKYSDLRASLEDAAVVEAGTAVWTLASLPTGVESFDLGDLSHAPDWVSRNLGTLGTIGAMDAASLAFAKGGLALRISGAVAEPLRLRLTGQGHARLLVVLEPGASATLVERHGAETNLRNTGTEIVLGAGAQFEHLRIAEEAAEGISLAGIEATLEREARYRGHFTNLGGKLSRVDSNILLRGEGASAELSGVDVLRDATHADVTTHVDHAVGNTQSTQIFKKVAGGKARSIYQGVVTVREGANGSDSRQTAKGLLLGDRAEIDLKPELEIFADDVKCAHGAAVGDLDVESLFYLKARGIPEDEARNLLIHAFLGDALDQIADETLRGEVWALVEAQLVQMGAA